MQVKTKLSKWALPKRHLVASPLVRQNGCLNEIQDDFETGSKIVFYLGERKRCVADDEPLKPKRLSNSRESKKVFKIVKQSLKRASRRLTKDIAERLNAEEDRHEEDVGPHNIPNGFCHQHTVSLLPQAKQRSEKWQTN